MVKLITLLEQHLDRLPPTVVLQATTRRETAFEHVKLMEHGPGVHLPVRVCCCWSFTIKTFGLLQPHFGHLWCLPVVYITPKDAYNLNESVIDKFFPFVGVGPIHDKRPFAHVDLNQDAAGAQP